MRAGRFRTPFGLHGRRTRLHGFLRAPLIATRFHWALSNTFLEHGVNVMVAPTRCQFRIHGGASGRRWRTAAPRRLDQVCAQGYHGDSSSATATSDAAYRTPAMPRARRLQRRRRPPGCAAACSCAVNGSTDSRATACTRAALHRRLRQSQRDGPITALARMEVLDYDAGARSVLARRPRSCCACWSLTACTRRSMRRTGAVPSTAPANSVDAALTYTSGSSVSRCRSPSPGIAASKRASWLVVTAIVGLSLAIWMW